MAQRSELHKASNDLDLEMHRVAGHMDRLASDLTRDDADRLRRAARSLLATRPIVRAYMHRDDRKATE